VLVSTLPVKPGYTTVEVQMPKDDDKRPRHSRSSKALASSIRRYEIRRLCLRTSVREGVLKC
jgi:hypothetical protein